MTGPRTVKGAAKRGWTVVYIPRREDLSWAGICNWIYSNAVGKFIPDYRFRGDGNVAFEQQEDAVKAVLFLNGSII